MLTHPDLINYQIKSRRDGLIAEAEHYRLLKLARQWRDACRVTASDRKAARRDADRIASTLPVAAASASVLAGTLAACGQHAVGSAR
jgi:hypothetical protein